MHLLDLLAIFFAMSGQNNSDSSTSDSELSATSSTFNPIKALYSKKVKVPDKSAPMYDNLQQYEAAQKQSHTLPVTESRDRIVKERKEEKERLRLQAEKELEEKNKLRFAKFEAVMVPRKELQFRNVLTRIEKMVGPLAALKDCVDKALRIKVITRKENGIRGTLQATLIAFDKQWNLALVDVLETWTRKPLNKRKIPPLGGTSVLRGTAALISAVPEVTEKPLSSGLVECTRHIPQLMMRGEHVVLINIVERCEDAVISGFKCDEELKGV